MSAGSLAPRHESIVRFFKGLALESIATGSTMVAIPAASSQADQRPTGYLRRCRGPFVGAVGRAATANNIDVHHGETRQEVRR
jgi:hypothetical protein